MVLASLLVASLVIDRPMRVQGTIERGLVWAPMRLEDKTLRLVVDTGAPISVLEVGAKNPKGLVIPSLGGGIRQRLSPFGLSVGDFDFPPLGTLHGAREDHTDGVLGFDLLKGHSIGFDYATGEIVLWKDGVRDAEAALWLGPRFTIVDARLDRLGLHVSTGLGSAVVASGRSETTFPMAALHTLTEADSAPRMVGDYGAGPTKMRAFMAHQLSIGALQLGDKLVYGDPTEREGRQNPSILGPRRVIVDFKGHRLIVGT